MPFILRGVVLRGVDSVMAPSGPRLAAWARLARDMDLELLETMVTEIGLSDVNDVAPDVLAGKVTGRLLVDVCLLYTSPSPRDATLSRMPSSA